MQRHTYLNLLKIRKTILVSSQRKILIFRSKQLKLTMYFSAGIMEARKKYSIS